MIRPTREKILCSPMERARKLPSGLWMADKLRSEKRDNVALCMGVGKGVKVVRKGDIVHYKAPFARKMTWEGKPYIVLKNDDVVALERCGSVLSVGSNVVVKLRYAESMGSIVVPDSVKQNSGDYWGEVVAVGPDFPDTLKAGDKVVYSRNEGYKFKAYGSGEELLSVQEKWIGGKRLCL